MFSDLNSFFVSIYLFSSIAGPPPLFPASLSSGPLCQLSSSFLLSGASSVSSIFIFCVCFYIFPMLLVFQLLVVLRGSPAGGQNKDCLQGHRPVCSLPDRRPALRALPRHPPARTPPPLAAVLRQGGAKSGRAVSHLPPWQPLRPAGSRPRPREVLRRVPRLQPLLGDLAGHEGEEGRLQLQGVRHRRRRQRRQLDGGEPDEQRQGP